MSEQNKLDKTIIRFKAVKISKKSLLILAILGFVFMNVSMIMVANYTANDYHFCLSCHATGETFNKGDTSVVHPPYSKVGCVDCHGNPGHSIVEFTHSKYAADRDRLQENCVSCHKGISEATESHIFKHNPLKIRFSHVLHVGTIGSGCVDCHANISHDIAVPKTNRPRMEYCFKCHSPEISKCDVCHHRGSVDGPLMDVIAKSECNRCHFDYASAKLKIYGMNFSHEGHLRRYLRCDECHSNKTKHGEIVQTRDGCLNCHHSIAKLECATCHKNEANTLAGVSSASAEPVEGPVSSHNCKQCHNMKAPHSRQNVLENCKKCHEEPDFVKKIDDWQNKFTETLVELRARAKRARISLGSATTEQIRIVEPRLNEIDASISKVETDRSEGVHNFDLMRRMTDPLAAALDDIEKQLSK